MYWLLVGYLELLIGHGNDADSIGDYDDDDDDGDDNDDVRW